MSDANEPAAERKRDASPHPSAGRSDDVSPPKPPASADEPAVRASTAPGNPSADAGDPIGRETDGAGPICEICGAVMFERHCKILCPVCGYQRDCSDP